VGIIIECKKLVDSDLTTLDALKKLFPHWKRNSVQRKIKETLSGKDVRFVALNEGQIIGHLKVTFGKGLHKHRVDFSSLVIAPAMRHHGVGTNLVEYALKNLPKEISLVLLAVDVKNKNAINLYKKLGFKKYGLLQRASFLNGKYVDNYLMKKDV
jgi:ribosomal protein S18 acetylase RimI-like enzyme